ncbi:MAG TPA: PH domain-containing protein [Longimicrobiales bacterium]|nr:PH domain-containing protein [Longimicrobiales bacterium]
MSVGRGLIDEQLQQLGESMRWRDQRELRDLPAVLHADERLLAVARGKLARTRLSRSWLIVVTNTRLLCLRTTGRATWAQLEVPASQIARVGLRVGPFRGRVLVVAGGYRYRLLVPRADAYKLASALSSIVPVKEAGPGLAPTRMVTRIVDHMLSLPAVALDPTARPAPAPPAPPDRSANDARLQLLEEQVQQLQQQVDFLEQLLRQRQAAPAELSRPQ